MNFNDPRSHAKQGIEGGMITIRRAALSLMAWLLTLVTNVATAVDILDDRGFHKDRAFFRQLPYEHVDPLTGNLLLTFTDLVLPGNAGFDLRIQRTYNSKIYLGNGSNTLAEDSWAGVGWSLHMGRVWDPDGQSVVEMPDGSQHRLYSHISAPPLTPTPCSPCFVTKEHWIYNKGNHTMRLPNGLVYTFGQLATFNLRPVRFVTQIADPFGNQVTIAYASSPPDRITTITQNLGNGQSRTIEFNPAGSPPSSWGNLTRMKYSQGGTIYNWTYVHAATTFTGFSLLKEVQPPTGPAWKYQYNESGPTFKYELAGVTTPYGGQISYSYGNYSTRLGSSTVFSFRGVATRTLEAVRGVPNGQWQFTYPSTTSNQGTVSSPCGQVTSTTFHGVGTLTGYNGQVWKVGVPLVRQTTDGGKTKTETYTWLQGTAVSGDQAILGTNSDPQVFVALLDNLETNFDGTTLTTNPGYQPANFNDYGQPNQVIDSGPAGTRTTTRTYKHNFGSSVYIRGRLESETVTVGTESFTRAWTYDTSNGFTTSETQHGVTTTFVPTLQGNIQSRQDPSFPATSYTYDWGRLKNTVTPVYTVSRTINPQGTLASETRRGFTTAFEYDGLFREILRTPPTGDPWATSYDVSGGFEVSTTSTRGSSFVKTLVDGLGRPTGTENAVAVKTSLAYDACGRKAFESYPFTGSSGPGTTFTYASFDRIGERQHPDLSTVVYTYTGIDVTIVDEEGNKTVQDWEAYGTPEQPRLASISEPSASIAGQTDGLTRYKYDALGSLTRVEHLPETADAYDRIWTYFSSGESHPGLLKTEQHPESGTVVYAYDPAGNLKTRTDPFGTTTFNYDSNQRLVSVDRPGSTHDELVGYDESDNRTCSVTYASSVSVSCASATPGANGGVKATFVWDGSNRLTQRVDTVWVDSASSQTFSSAFTYWSHDGVKTITYPSGKLVSYEYDNGPRISRVANAEGASPSIRYAENFSYHASGGVTGFKPNGVGTPHPAQTFSYDISRYWLTSVSSGARSLAYTDYDRIGNVRTIDDARADMDRSFAYDGLSRLKTASGYWGSGATFTYDKLGNRKSDPIAGSSNWTYFSNRLMSAPGLGSFGYDPSGNMTSDGVRTYTYTPTNLLETATQSPVVTTYRYDGEGLRKRKSDASGTRYYLHGPNGQLLSEFVTGCSQLTWVRDYVYAGSRLLASVEPDTLPPSVGFVSGGASLPEAVGAVGAVVQLTTPDGLPLSAPVTVAFATANGSAQAGSDFTAASGTLTFPACSASGSQQTITVAIANDALDEPNEDFSIVLSNVTGGVPGAITTHVVTIQDDDPEPSLSIGDVTMREGDGVSPASFTVSLSAASGKTVTVDYTTAPWTAIAGIDYTSASGTLTFTPGTTSQPINVDILGDRLFDGYEEFDVNLSSPVNATLPDSQALGILLDDDGMADFPGDYNGDGKADILWYKASTGDVYLWLMDVLMDVGTIVSQAPVSQLAPSTGWRIATTADYDGDDRTDILWRNWITGEVYIWFMNGATVISHQSVATVSDLNWKVVANGDYNGDGLADMLWRHAVTGEVRMWLMSGTPPTMTATDLPVVASSNLDLQIAGAGDHNGDGKSDILWHYQKADPLQVLPVVEVWLMNGAVLLSSGQVSLPQDPHWQIAGSRDFDGDGMADLLWYHKVSGNLFLWFMSGAQFLSSGIPPSPGSPDWEVVATRDFNLDAKADILWRNRANGNNNLWLMNGASATSVYVPSEADLNWRVVGPR